MLETIHLIISILIVPSLKESYKNHTHKEGPFQFHTHFEGPSFPSFQAEKEPISLTFRHTHPGRFPNKLTPPRAPYPLPSPYSRLPPDPPRPPALEGPRRGHGRYRSEHFTLMGPLTLKFNMGDRVISLNPLGSRPLHTTYFQGKGIYFAMKYFLKYIIFQYCVFIGLAPQGCRDMGRGRGRPPSFRLEFDIFPI